MRENVFKYKYSILYFENAQNTCEIGHFFDEQWNQKLKIISVFTNAHNHYTKLMVTDSD